MNNGLIESENALNCIIENYVNELQRNTCDDDEEDMRIYQEKMDNITSQKEIILKDLEELEELKRIMGTPIQDIREKLRKLEYYENEKYKHWNIFFNGAKLEYLLYLEKEGVDHLSLSISEKMFTEIKTHFLMEKK